MATIAVIAQEMDSLAHAGASYGRTRALIYHPRSLGEGAAWKLDQAFELDTPPGGDYAAHFASLDPDARALVYWNDCGGSVSRYDPRDGRLLGQMEVGPVAARSGDGARIATTIRGHVRVYEIATGQTLLDIPIGRARRATADGSGIVARQGDRLSPMRLIPGG